MNIKRYVVEYSITSLIKYCLFVIVVVSLLQHYFHWPSVKPHHIEPIQNVKLIVFNRFLFEPFFTLKVGPHQNRSLRLTNYIKKRYNIVKYTVKPKSLKVDMTYLHHILTNKSNITGLLLLIHNPTNKTVNATIGVIYNLGHIPHIIGFGLFAKHIESPNCTPAFENSSQQTVAFFCPKETSMDKLLLLINKRLSQINVDDNTAAIVGFFLPYIAFFILLFVLPFILGLKHEQKISIAKLYLVQPRDVEEMIPEMVEDIKAYMKEKNLSKNQLDPVDRLVLSKVANGRIARLCHSLRKIRKKMEKTTPHLSMYFIWLVGGGIVLGIIALVGLWLVDAILSHVFNYQILTAPGTIQSPFIPPYIQTLYIFTILSLSFLFLYDVLNYIQSWVQYKVIHTIVKLIYLLLNALPFPRWLREFFVSVVEFFHRTSNVLATYYSFSYLFVFGSWVREVFLTRQ